MSKKNSPGTNGLVYSTDPNFSFQPEETNEAETLPPALQKLKIKLETKHRAGKAVTLITGFMGSNDDVGNTGKKTKKFLWYGRKCKGRRNHYPGRSER